MTTKIVDLVARDIRFPTSRTLAGSDAVNKAPDYSAAYVILKTDRPDGLEGHGMTFTIGEGNDICVLAEKDLAHLVVGEMLNQSLKTWVDSGDISLMKVNYAGWVQQKG